MHQGSFDAQSSFSEAYAADDSALSLNGFCLASLTDLAASKLRQHNVTDDKSTDRGIRFKMADVGTGAERGRDRNILNLL